MTTSGTYTTFDVSTILEEAYERAGLEMKSGYDIRTGIRSFNFMMAEWANKGLNLWTIDNGVIPLVSGTASYTLPANTVDALDVVIRNSANTDIMLERISATQYAILPNKLMSSTPNSYMVSRSSNDTPTITLWPVPNDSSQSIAYWRLRRIQEAGGITNTADVPFRFLPALVAGLAYYIAMKKNQTIAPALKMVYDEVLNDAMDEDRERASVFFFPDVND